MHKVFLGVVLLGLGFNSFASETAYVCNMNTLTKIDIQKDISRRTDPIKEQNTIIVSDEAVTIKAGGLFSKDKYFYYDAPDRIVSFGDKMMLVNRLDYNSVIIYLGREDFQHTKKDYKDVLVGAFNLTECRKL